MWILLEEVSDARYPYFFEEHPKNSWRGTVVSGYPAAGFDVLWSVWRKGIFRKGGCVYVLIDAIFGGNCDF